MSYIRNHFWLTIANGLPQNCCGVRMAPESPAGFLAEPGICAFVWAGDAVRFIGMWKRRAHWREDSIIYLASLFLCSDGCVLRAY